jgi:hypothetical protein
MVRIMPNYRETVSTRLEIKGYEVHNVEQLNSKHNAARKWVSAVNNLKEFGRWDFTVCRDLGLLMPKLAELAGVSLSVIKNPVQAENGRSSFLFE